MLPGLAVAGLRFVSIPLNRLNFLSLGVKLRGYVSLTTVREQPICV